MIGIARRARLQANFHRARRIPDEALGTFRRGLCSRPEAPPDLEEYLLSWDHLLTEEEKAARWEAHSWVQSTFLPSIDEANQRGIFPYYLRHELGGLGALGGSTFGPSIRRGSVANGLIMQELERGDSALRSVCSTQSMVMKAIQLYGSDDQRDGHLRRLAEGASIGCFALTDPPARPGEAAEATVARRDGDDFILSGVKTRVVNAPMADIAVVWAQVAGEDNLLGFLIGRDFHGFGTTDAGGGGPSLRLLPTGDLVLPDVRVRAHDLLPGTGSLRAPLSCVMEERQDVGWGVTGAAVACYEAALEHGRQHSAFGRPLAASQLFQSRLADMAGSIASCQLLSLHYSRLKDMGKLDPVQVSLLVRHNVAAARRVAATAQLLAGGEGAEQSSVARHLANIQAIAAQGADDTLGLAIGRALTGLDALN